MASASAFTEGFYLLRINTSVEFTPRLLEIWT